MTPVSLRRITPAELPGLLRRALPASALQQARVIIEELRSEGEPALRRWATKLDHLDREAPLFYAREALHAACERIDGEQRALLERTAARITRFAATQRAALVDAELVIEGGAAG